MLSSWLNAGGIALSTGGAIITLYTILKTDMKNTGTYQEQRYNGVVDGMGRKNKACRRENVIRIL